MLSVLPKSRKKAKKFGIGTLLRVKNLEQFSAFKENEIACTGMIEKRKEYNERENFISPHATTFKKFFHTLPLKKSLGESYVGKVVHAIYDPLSYYPVWVGIKFYTSYDAETNSANHPWKHSKDAIFYYHFSNTIVFDKIKQFESLDAGDLITYGESRSGVVMSNSLSARRCISLHGVTRHVVRYFNNEIRIQYLYPQRKYKLIR